MSSTKSIATLAALAAAALIGSAAMSTVPASAAAVVPAAGAVQCSGDLCIQNLSPSGVSPATIKAWARTTTFTGHFELVFPDGVVKNSPNHSWTGGGAGFNFTGVGRGNGYRMTAWKGTSRFTDIGDVGFSV